MPTSPRGSVPRTPGPRAGGWGCCRIAGAPGSRSHRWCCRETTRSRGSSLRSWGEEAAAGSRRRTGAVHPCVHPPPTDFPCPPPLTPTVDRWLAAGKGKGTGAIGPNRMGWVPGNRGPWETFSLVSDFRVKVRFVFFLRVKLKVCCK